MRDSHMHTPLCKHAGDFSPSEYAASALERENPLDGITFTCHSPPFAAPNGEWTTHVRMSRNEYDEYIELISSAARKFKGQLDILTGLEVDFIPEKSVVAELHAMLARHPLDWVLGSIHPHLTQYQDLYAKRDSESSINFYEFQRTYFDHLALAAEATLADGSKMFDALAHPDLVKVVCPEDWQPERILEDVIEPALDRIAATGVALEVNTSGLNKRPNEMHPTIEMLKGIQKRGISVIIGSDAHTPERVGADFDQAIKNLDRVGITEIIVPIGSRQFETRATSDLKVGI